MPCAAAGSPVSGENCHLTESAQIKWPCGSALDKWPDLINLSPDHAGFAFLFWKWAGEAAAAGQMRQTFKFMLREQRTISSLLPYYHACRPTAMQNSRRHGANHLLLVAVLSLGTLSGEADGA